MIVRCIENRIANLKSETVRKRLAKTIHLDEIRDLEIGKDYKVQAIEDWDDGVYVYLQRDDLPDFPYAYEVDLTQYSHPFPSPYNEYPHPYPIELFSIVDSSICKDWCIRVAEKNGRLIMKRITFPEWANDDSFFEKLIDEDIETVLIYHKRARR